MTKTILITGASSGFGADTARTLLRAGHRVFASMRGPRERNRAAAEALRADGAHIVELDVTDDISVEKAIAQVLSQAGRLDVLINNAGIASAGVSEAFTPDQVRQVFNTNVVGIIRTLRAALPSMRAKGDGLVINVGSILGRITFPFFGIYGASKFAVEALTDSYRYELAPLGVDMVLVQPSAYPTNMYAAVLHPADAPRAAEYGATGEIPGRMFESFTNMFQGASAPDPHDVADAIAKLIEQPKGARPARVVVGQSFGAEAINIATAPVQQGAIEALGLGTLSRIGA